MESLAEVEKFLQKPFEEKKLDFKPKLVLSVTILSYRDIKSKSVFQRVFHSFIPQFHVSCSQLEGKNWFSTTTRSSKENSEINENFKFVLPENHDDFVLEIQLYDDGLFIDKLGKVTIKISDVKVGETIEKTCKFDKYHGEFDMTMSKEERHEPDFRLGLGLNENEKKFRLKRIPKVFDSLKTLLGAEKAPKSVEKTPVISVVGSGGGYRAMVGMSGAMAALKDAGILDALTYASGLSGLSWYLTTAYAREGMEAETQQRLHEQLREAVGYNLYDSFFDLGLDEEYFTTYEHTKKLFDEPLTFVDYYGFMLGHRLLGDKVTSRLSDMQDYVMSANVPFPTFIALHVKDTIPSGQFHAYMENSPFEIGFPHYGIGLSPGDCGSVWRGGIIEHKTPEAPLYYYQGMCGSAFGVLLKSFLKGTGEHNAEFIHEIDEMRHHKETDGNKQLGKDNGEPSSSSQSAFKRCLIKNIMNCKFVKNRNALIKRTAEVYNFSNQFNSIKAFQLNPLHIPPPDSGEEKKMIEEFGYRKAVPMSTEDQIISICDAGVLKNVCVEAVTRPQRTPDLLLVMDFNRYKSDSDFNYHPIFEAAQQSWRQGVEFPPVDFEKLANTPPEELLIFESNNDNCPTVMWFTLCNKKFKSLKDYKPPPGDERKGEVFNDFPVFDKGTAYSTSEFHFTKYQFDRLHQLMYFNVNSHMDEIKEQIEKAVQRKERNIAKLLNSI